MGNRRSTTNTAKPRDGAVSAETLDPGETPIADAEAPGEAEELGEAEDHPEEQSLPFFIGAPFAMMGGPSDADAPPPGLLQRATADERSENPHACQGCVATIACGCGQPFVHNLLSDKLSTCPNCGERFTSMLVVSTETDGDVLRDAWEHMRLVNVDIDPEDLDNFDADQDDD